MKMVNFSCRPQRVVRQLTAFVLSQNHYGDLPVVNVTNAIDPSRFGGGLARKLNCNRSKERWNEYDITVGVSKVAYPTFTLHARNRTPILIDSWEEEFVFILAHELRHIEQFACQVYSKDRAEAMEADADDYALQVLNKYRQLQALHEAACAA